MNGEIRWTLTERESRRVRWEYETREGYMDREAESVIEREREAQP